MILQSNRINFTSHMNVTVVEEHHLEYCVTNQF